MPCGLGPPRAVAAGGGERNGHLPGLCHWVSHARRWLCFQQRWTGTRIPGHQFRSYRESRMRGEVRWALAVSDMSFGLSLLWFFAPALASVQWCCHSDEVWPMQPVLHLTDRTRVLVGSALVMWSASRTKAQHDHSLIHLESIC